MTIVEVEEIVEIGEIPPDQVSTILEKYLMLEQITICFFSGSYSIHLCSKSDKRRKLSEED